MDRLKEILVSNGFVAIDIDTKDVSEEYANKWGIELDLREYIQSSTITAYK